MVRSGADIGSSTGACVVDLGAVVVPVVVVVVVAVVVAVVVVLGA